MKNETSEKVLEYLRTHPAHECMKKDIALATGLGTTTVNIVVEWLLGAGKIRVARKFGNAKAYEIVEEPTKAIPFVSFEPGTPSQLPDCGDQEG